jgi:alpha-beta hydrolase superfamily lysophospholipase
MPPAREPNIHHEYDLVSADGLKLYAQSWMPEKKPLAMVNIVHGFKDHSGRFTAWANKLTHEGFGVMAVDLRGHGRSAGRRGYAGKFNKYLQDVKVLCLKSRQMFGDVPHFLYGHSLGGNIVTNYLMAGNSLPDAAVITSPWFTLATKPSVFTLASASMMRHLLPWVMVKSDLNPNALSHDPRVAEDYLHDPLVHNKISPRLFFEIEEKGLKASRNIYKINIPLLVMHGSDDTITSCKQTRAFVLNAGHLTTYKEWPGCFHELHNDILAEEVFRFLVQWLKKQVSA